MRSWLGYILNWRLWRVHRSTGKYGIGFRSCFHITDTPEIPSGPYLATFDPLKQILPTTGTRREFVKKRNLSAHLATFSSVLASNKPYRHPYNATALRFPLRHANLHENSFGPVVNCDDMQRLLEEFVHREIASVMLFLRNIRTIHVRLVALTHDPRGWSYPVP